MEIIQLIFWIYSKLCIFEVILCPLERSREVIWNRVNMVSTALDLTDSSHYGKRVDFKAFY